MHWVISIVLLAVKIIIKDKIKIAKKPKNVKGINFEKLIKLVYAIIPITKKTKEGINIYNNKSLTIFVVPVNSKIVVINIPS